jgi:hypothetical protein
MQTLDGARFITDEDIARIEKETNMIVFHSTGGMNMKELQSASDSMATHIRCLQMLKERSLQSKGKDFKQKMPFTQEEIDKAMNEIMLAEKENDK